MIDIPIPLQTRWLPEAYDAIAPDGSEIRLLATVRGASMVHCALPPGAVSKAVAHRRVEELWYCLSGEGQVWRRLGEAEEVVDVRAGCSLNIPTGASFQFRNTGSAPLCLIITTIPPWPGDDEAIPREGRW